MRDYTGVLRQAAVSEGVLRYSEQDRWTYVEVVTATSR
jgi:hypothetical protein